MHGDGTGRSCDGVYRRVVSDDFGRIPYGICRRSAADKVRHRAEQHDPRGTARHIDLSQFFLLLGDNDIHVASGRMGLLSLREGPSAGE